jgi:O-antigen/teichoic acid export membrane protein
MDRSITSGFLAVVSTKLLLLALGLVTSPLFTRLLGERAYGDYSFLLSVFAIYMIFVSSGVTDGVRKYLAEDRRVLNWPEQVVGFYLRIAVVLGVLGAGVLVLAARSGVVSQFVGNDQFEIYFYLLGGLVLAAQFRAYTRRTLMGFGLERYSESLKVAYRVTFVVTGLALASLGYGVPGVLVGHIVGSLLAAVAGGIVIARRVSLAGVFRIPGRSFPRKEMVFYNGLNVVLVFLLMSLFHVDVLMLRVLTDGPQTGFYKVALILAEFLWVVPTSMQTVLLHSTSAMWANEGRAQINRLTARVTRYTMLFTTLLAIGIGALAPTAIPVIWPDSYAVAVTPLYLLLPGALGFAIARPILAVGQGKGELNVLILTTGVAAVLNVGLNWVLINRYGILGAAVATSVGYGAMFFLHVWSARSIGFDPLGDARLLRVAATALLSVGPIFALSRLIDPPLLALVVVPVAGALIYFPLAVLTGALDVDETLEVLEQFPLVGTWAAQQRAAASGLGASDLTSQLQAFLAVVGVLFFVGGLVVTFVGAGGPVVAEMGFGNQSAPSTTAPATDRPVVTETTGVESDVADPETTTPGGGGETTTATPETTTTDDQTTASTATATTSTPTSTTTDEPSTTEEPTTMEEATTTDEPTTTEEATTTEESSTTTSTTTSTPTSTTTTTSTPTSTSTSTTTSTPTTTEEPTTNTTTSSTTSTFTNTTTSTTDATTSTANTTTTSTTNTSTETTDSTTTSTGTEDTATTTTASLFGGVLQVFSGESLLLVQTALVLTFAVRTGR